MRAWAVVGAGVFVASGAGCSGEMCSGCGHGDGGMNAAPSPGAPGPSTGPSTTTQPDGGTTTTTGAGLTGRCEGDRWIPTGPMRDLPSRYAAVKESCGVALATKLCEMVRDGYRARSYTEARRLVPREVDVHEGRVQGVYDGIWHDPGMTDINIEHTWPQSRGARDGDAKSDMHHLFSTRSDYNSARGNLPLGEVSRHSWPTTVAGDPDCTTRFPGHDEGCFSMKGRDEDGVDVFEPRDGQKGNAARAIFYFAIRYGESCARLKSLSAFDPSHPAVTEAVLKRWNELDPPDEHEGRRNERVEAVQGVRNPFVDVPELAERISFQ